MAYIDEIDNMEVHLAEASLCKDPDHSAEIIIIPILKPFRGPSSPSHAFAKPTFIITSSQSALVKTSHKC